VRERVGVGVAGRRVVGLEDLEVMAEGQQREDRLGLV